MRLVCSPIYLPKEISADPELCVMAEAALNARGPCRKITWRAATVIENIRM